MKPVAFNQGDCFKFTERPEFHLFVVVTDPNRNPSAVVLFNLTTLKSKSDCTCILQPGDHPFVKHASVIAYSYGRVLEASNINSLLARGLIDFEDPMPIEVLKRIIEGALLSPATPQVCSDAIVGR